jgi:uncharacterized alpha-E superfamily protein
MWMLSRVADSLYWMSRYLVRADHVARQLDVHLSVVPEQGSEAAGRRRGRLIAALLPEGNLTTEVTTDEALADLLTFNQANDDSIVRCVGAARENARQIREQINSQMWEQINQIHLTVRAASLEQLWEGQPHLFYHGLNQEVYRFYGIADARMSRDQGWHFIQLGCHLERATATAKLLAEEFHALVGRSPGDQYSYLEWVGLLRSCAAFEAYGKVYTAEVEPRNIAEFLLLNPELPHSVHFAVDRIQRALTSIGVATHTGTEARVSRLAGRLHALLAYGQIDEIMEVGLDDFLRDVRQMCNQIHEAVYLSYVAYPIEERLLA